MDKTKTFQQDALEFAATVKALWPDSKEEIKSACKAKLKELEQDGRWNQTMLVKRIQPTYRKVMMSELGIEKYTEEPIKYFTFPHEWMNKIAEKTQINLEKTRLDRIKISEKTIDLLIDKAVSLLGSTNIYDRAVALALLTGRRMFVEILRQGKLTPKTENTCYFSGQAKGGETKRERGYVIPVLGSDSEMIASAHDGILEEMVRKYPDLDSMSAKDFESRNTQNIRRRIDKHFVSIDGCPMLSPHDLRKLYAAICDLRINRNRYDQIMYFSMILGHDKANSDGTFRSAGSTSLSYIKFVIQ